MKLFLYEVFTIMGKLLGQIYIFTGYCLAWSTTSELALMLHLENEVGFMKS